MFFFFFFFFFFFVEYELLTVHNNIVKISEKLNKRNLLKICLQVTYSTAFCTCIHFTMRKSENIWLKKKKKKKKKND